MSNHVHMAGEHCPICRTTPIKKTRTSVSDDMPFKLPGLDGIILSGDPFNMGARPDAQHPASATEPDHHGPLVAGVGIGSIVGFAFIGAAVLILMLGWFGYIG